MPHAGRGRLLRRQRNGLPLALEAGSAHRPDRAALHRGGLGLLAVLAVVAPAAADLLAGAAGRRGLRRRRVALTQFLYYVAIGRMPVGIALVFEMTAPVFIALYVWLVRRENVRSQLWLALLLSLSGLVLVAEVWQDGGSLDSTGVAAALLAALCLATYYLMGERARCPATR